MTTLEQWMLDPNLGNLAAPTFEVHHVIAALIDGCGNTLAGRRRQIAERVTQRKHFSRERVRRCAFIAGRRSGKTEFMAQVATHAASQDYRSRLSPGEVAVVACVAPDRKTAAVLFERIRARVFASPYMVGQVLRETSDTIEFVHGTVIEVYAASFRSTRGRTFAAVLIDEAAQLRSEESANPDVELVRAVAPGLATLAGMLMLVTTPYMKTGLTWEWYRKYFGRDDADVLVVNGPTELFNPSPALRAIAMQAKEEDAEGAGAEWDATFRSDLSSAFSEAAIDSAVDGSVLERPRLLALPSGGPNYHVAFCDPAGGTQLGRDSFTACVVHADGSQVIEDALLEIRPPFNTGEAARMVAEFVKRYGLSSVRGDKYAGGWPRDALAAHGVVYSESEQDKSTIYRECVPLFSTGRVRLLDSPRTVAQLKLIERRVRPGGRDSFDHPVGGHDDCANALCGALFNAAAPAAKLDLTPFFVPTEFRVHEDSPTRGMPSPWNLI